MLFLLVGFAAGAGAVWLVFQGRTNAAYARARAELEAAIKEATERLRAKDDELLTMQSTIQQNAAAMEALKVEVAGLTTGQDGFTAEKAELAAQVEARDRCLATLESELSAAKAALAAQAEKPEAPPPPLQAPEPPALEENVLRVLARPIEEHLADLRVRIEQLSAARPEAVLGEETLRTISRPIEEQLSLVRRRLERMECEQAQSAAAAVNLQTRNTELQERLNHVTRGVSELRGALSRSLDLCCLAVSTSEPEGAQVQAPELDTVTG